MFQQTNQIRDFDRVITEKNLLLRYTLASRFLWFFENL